jgi:hypothetical protein
MHLEVSASDRKILLIGAGVFFFLLITTVLVAGGGGSQEETPTTYSTSSGGARAAYLLLKETGYKIATWEQPLRELKAGKGTTLVLADPSTAPATEDRKQLEAFLRRGGSLIATGTFSAFYLPSHDVIPDPIAGLSWKELPALSPSAITRVAPRITMAPLAYWSDNSNITPLYGEADKPVVVKFKVGEGEVLWLGASTPLTNAGLKEPANLDFLFAAVGDPVNSHILWDEFIHGYQSHASSSKTNRIIGWISLQLALFAIATLLAYSRRSGPVWMPAEETRLSPLEFVRTLGSLYQHADAGGVAVDIWYQRFRYLLTRRLGLPVNASVGDLERATKSRWPSPEQEDPAFQETLRQCESYRYDRNIRPAEALHLVQNLYDYAHRLKLVKNPEGRNAWKRS